MSEAIDAMDAQGEPYPGLRSFRRDETHIFFGREDTISEMVDRLAEHHFLAVTGHSGSGKSSLVRTGLIDALERGLLVEAGTEWAVADFAPGGQPFTRLTAAMAKAVGREFSQEELGLIEAKLARGPMGLVDWLDEIQFDPDTNVLVLVDQFEEIFRFRQGQIGEDIEAFVQLLLASAKQPGRKERRRIYVVITMRSDFLGDCARFTDLAETINDGQFLTPRLTREQCRAAIEGPAAVYDGRVEPALVTRMLNDMGGNPDQLPLMQHVLMLMWQEATERAGGDPPVLTLADYQRLGGIGSANRDAVLDDGSDIQRPSLFRRLFGRLLPTRAKSDAGADPSKTRVVNGALSDHADAVLATLTPQQQALAAGLFRALTQSEGAGGRDVRRPVRLSQASAITDAPVGDLVSVIEAFRAPGRNFLTPLPPIPLTPDTTIDISHESLIRQWVKLREWVREEFQSAEMYRYIERRAKQWKAGLGNLLARLDLAVARKWRREERPNKAWAERYGSSFDLAMGFLRKSERSRTLRRTFIVASSSIVIAIVLSTTLLSLLLMGVMTTLSYQNPADEWTDFGVPAQTVLQRDIGTSTPLTVPGGRVIGTAELETALKRGTLDNEPFIAIDVLRRLTWTRVVPDSVYIEYGGNSGSFDDDVQPKLEAQLAKLTKGNLKMPLVFFCQGSKCWESYNAVLRALKIGYTNVYWYRGGIAAWREAHRRNPINFLRLPPGAIQTGVTEIWATVRDVVWPDPLLYYKRGLEFADRKQFDNALDDFNKAISIDSKHADAYIARARAYAGKGDYDLALADLEKALAVDSRKSAIIGRILRDPSYAAGYVARGKKFFKSKQYAKAIEEYDKAIDLAPDTYDANYSRGEALYQMGDYRRAVQSFDRAIAINPESVNAYNDRGNSYYNTGDYDRSIVDYTKAIALSPRDKVLFSNRAGSYVRKRDCGRAIVDFSAAIALDPKYANAYQRRGTCYIAREDFIQAVSDLTQAIALDPDNVDALVDRASAYLYRQDYQHAIQDATDAISRRRSNATAFTVRARAKLYSQAPDLAAADFVESIKQRPSDYFTVFWLHLARIRAGQPDADELRANGKDINEKAWPAPILRMFLGTDTPEAVIKAASEAATAIGRNDNACDAAYYIAIDRNAKGRPDVARKLFQSALEICPKSFPNSYLEFFGSKEELRRMDAAKP
jgi:PQQ-dependent catabolism-associated CXXCW motif protein